MTGYGNKYISSFKDSNDDTITVTIMKKGYEGTTSNLILVASNPVVISKPQGDLMTSIFGTGCKISIVNTGTFLQYTEMFGTPEREHYVIVKKLYGDREPQDEIILFQGFVLPQLYEQGLKHKALITISANDQLSSLKNKKSTILADETIAYVNVMDLLKEIVWSTGLELPIYIKNGIYNTFYTAEFDEEITPFDESYFDRNLYLDDTGIPKDSFFVLESILKTFGSRIYYSDGRWFIDRVKNTKNLTDYKVYELDASTSNLIINHPEIELTDSSVATMFAQAGSMMYVTGVKEYDLTLNLDLFGNYVNNNFTGITGTEDKVEYSWLSGGAMIYVVPARTTKYKWVTNDRSEFYTIFNIFNDNYSDQNISSGIDWSFLEPPGIVRNASITTKISVDYDTEATLTIKANATVPYVNLYNHSVRFKYALRYQVNNTPAYNWITRPSVDASLVSNGFDYNNNPLFLYSAPIDGNTILESNNPTLFEINESLPIGELMTLIKGQISPALPLEFVEFYLDVFQIESKAGSPAASGSWNPIRTRIGDFNVKSTSKLENNIINATIEEDYNSKIDLRLDLFDYPSITVKNPILFKEGDLYKIPPKWNEVDFEYSRRIHMMYLTDLIQNYSTNRYSINSIVRFGSEIPMLGSIYTLDYIEKDSLPVEFIAMGYDYNCKDAAFNLFIEEWTDYNDYALIEEIDAGGTPYIDVDPSTMTFSYLGGWDILTVTSNIDWTAEVDDPSVFLSKISGTGNDTINVYVDEVDELDPGLFATITIKNLSETITKTVEVTQLTD